MSPVPEKTQVTQIQLVVFRIAAQLYAAPIHRVKEVLSCTGITVLPSAPSFLEGVIDVRGTLIPVIDLRKRLGFSQPQNNLETRIMVLSSGKRRVGAIVDSVLQVVSIPVEKIQEPPDTTRIHGVNYILAFAKSAGEIYIILDLDHLLTSSEVLSLEQDSDQSGTEAIRKD